MLRSGVTARRIGDARARDDSPATGDRRPRAPRTAHLPAVSRATKLNQVLQVYTSKTGGTTGRSCIPRHMQFMRTSRRVSRRAPLSPTNTHAAQTNTTLRVHSTPLKKVPGASIILLTIRPRTTPHNPTILPSVAIGLSCLHSCPQHTWTFRSRPRSI